jgi:hypothetical protein
MTVKKGDLIDERKRHSDGCGLVVKVMSGGVGFEKIVCCSHDLTEDDIVEDMGSSSGRKKGMLPPAVVIDEKLLYPDSCGLRIMIMAGGAGFQEVRCCGHSLTIASVRELRYSQLGGSQPGQSGHSGTA